MSTETGNNFDTIKRLNLHLLQVSQVPQEQNLSIFLKKDFFPLNLDFSYAWKYAMPWNTSIYMLILWQPSRFISNAVLILIKHLTTDVQRNPERSNIKI